MSALSIPQLIDRLRTIVYRDGPTAVAARAGISERTVYAWLSGRRDPARMQRATRQGLERALDVA